ncbi:MAG TPA: (2Fe-2S) ferredoxin domain-containing protein, partial [Bryobacteraceae bacterium]|nr:(2Fe-2S) ferredoxin domain-containing protein [Bryobacteraceae bacterium]
MRRITDIASFSEAKAAGMAKLMPLRPRIAVGMGTCGTGNGAESVYQAFASAIDFRGLDAELTRTGCFGFCAQEPLVNVRL